MFNLILQTTPSEMPHNDSCSNLALIVMVTDRDEPPAITTDNQSKLAAQSNLRLAQLTLNCGLAMVLKNQTSNSTISQGILRKFMTLIQEK